MVAVAVDARSYGLEDKIFLAFGPGRIVSENESFSLSSIFTHLTYLYHKSNPETTNFIQVRIREYEP
jgi:hypothetical protein